MSEEKMKEQALADAVLEGIAGGEEEAVVERPSGYWINPDECTACAYCTTVCPTGCIKDRGTYYSIETSMCAQCGSCADACPNCAVHD